MRIDFYFDFISPFSYLAAVRVRELKRATGAEVVWIPVNLPRLIKLSGNVPPATIPTKARYLILDLKRQAGKLQAPLKLIMPGTFDSRPALRIACSLPDRDREDFASAVFSALWTGEVSAKQQDWLQQVFEKKGLPGEWQIGHGEHMDERLQENTLQALKAGAFGVPSFVLHNRQRRELYFGLDHMQDLQERCMELAKAD